MSSDSEAILFELRSKDGHEYRLYLNWKAYGYADCKMFVNRVLPLFHKSNFLPVRKEDIPTSIVANKQPDAVT